MITIIGLAAKDAILIISFARELHARGAPLAEAAIEATRLRFRPILMTGFAFVCGVVPMVVASGASAKSQQTLGTEVIGGMIAVVVMALVMAPVFFVFVQRIFAQAGAAPTPPRRRRIRLAARLRALRRNPTRRARVGAT